MMTYIGSLRLMQRRHFPMSQRPADFEPEPLYLPLEDPFRDEPPPRSDETEEEGDRDGSTVIVIEIA